MQYRELGRTGLTVGASEQERDFSGALPALDASLKGQCVYCNHCIPCTQGIDIARVSRLADEGEFFPERERGRSTRRFPRNRRSARSARFASPAVPMVWTS